MLLTLKKIALQEKIYFGNYLHYSFEGLKQGISEGLEADIYVQAAQWCM